MATEITIESVLEQFAELSVKEQQKFFAEAVKSLQGKKSTKKTASPEAEDKPKKEMSEGQKKYMALCQLVRDTVKKELKLEKSPQKPVMSVAGRFKEADNYEPSTEEIVALYNEYIASPWESKSAKAKAAKSESGSEAKPKAAESESESEEEEEKPKKAPAKKKAAPK